MIGFAAERLMELKVGASTGAAWRKVPTRGRADLDAITAQLTRKGLRDVKLFSPPPSQKHDSQAVSYTTPWDTILEVAKP